MCYGITGVEPPLLLGSAPKNVYIQGQSLAKYICDAFYAKILAG